MTTHRVVALVQRHVERSGTPTPLTDQARDIDRVWNGFLVLAIGVGLLVVVLLAYIVVRFRRRPLLSEPASNDERARLPRQVRENIRMEVLYTAIPLLVVGGLFAVTFVSVRALDRVDDDPDLVVEVTGYQWSWQFDYPDSGVSVTGSDDAVPVLVLPAGERVRFDLTSADVIHSFWIPGFRFKRDMFPGEFSSFQVDVTDEPGSYVNLGICAEFCGLDHAAMRFSLRIVAPDDFASWIAAEEGRP